MSGPGRSAAASPAPRAYDGPLGGLYAITGEKIAERGPAFCNFSIYWDADPLAELLDGTSIAKWDWEKGQLQTLLTADGATANDGGRALPCLVGDLLGDWREEAVWIAADGNSLRIYLTDIPAESRMPTLLSDRMYRLSIVSQNVGYNRPPSLSFDLFTRMNP